MRIKIKQKNMETYLTIQIWCTDKVHKINVNVETQTELIFSAYVKTIEEMKDLIKWLVVKYQITDKEKVKLTIKENEFIDKGE